MILLFDYYLQLLNALFETILNLHSLVVRLDALNAPR
jgi:hypothetical protein